jgi:hypothetical protein
VTRRACLLLRSAAGFALAIALAGCTGAATSPTPAAPSTGNGEGTTPTPTARATGTGAASARPAATPPTTTDTAWGRIWDGLPAAFPSYPKAEPAAAGDGPASAILAVPAKAATAAAWYRSALARAGYGIDAVSGPLEDGSLVIDATGSPPACHVEVSLVPHGGSSTATILLGAACPYR